MLENPVVKRDRWSPIRWLSVDGRRVRCRTLAPAQGGDALTTLPRPLLLLHGLAGSGDAWGPTLRCLELRRLPQPVFAPDLPGHGSSAGARTTLGMDELGDWSAHLLDVLEIPRADLAATSMGCQVTLALARRHPERVGSLLLAAPTTGRRLVSPFRYVLGMGYSFREPLAYKPVALRLFLQMGVRRYLATVWKLMQDDPIAAAPAVKAPCLVVRGELDAIVPARAARHLAEALPCGAFVSVPRAGHVLQYNNADVFTEILLTFLVGAPLSGVRLGLA